MIICDFSLCIHRNGYVGAYSQKYESSVLAVCKQLQIGFKFVLHLSH